MSCTLTTPRRTLNGGTRGCACCAGLPRKLSAACTRPSLGAEREPEVMEDRRLCTPSRHRGASGGLGCRTQPGRPNSVPQRRPVLTPERWAEGWPPKCLHSHPQKPYTCDLMSQRVLSTGSHTEDSETGEGPGFPGGTPEVIGRYLFCLRISAKTEDMSPSAGPWAPPLPRIDFSDNVVLLPPLPASEEKLRGSRRAGTSLLIFQVCAFDDTPALGCEW